MLFTKEQIDRLPGSEVTLRRGSTGKLPMHSLEASKSGRYYFYPEGKEPSWLIGDYSLCANMDRSVFKGANDIIRVIKWADGLDDDGNEAMTETEKIMNRVTPTLQSAQDQDIVNHPPHYTSSDAVCSSCGHQIECIDVVKHLDFPLGNAIKYLWRCGKKDDAVQDLRKAIWYIEREIELREKSTN